MITLEKGAKEVVLPAGKYIIADPCYHVPDADWDRVLTESDFFEGQCWATFDTFDGRTGTVVAFSTAHGDGVYKDYTGGEYGVDAGLIGIISLNDIDPSELDEKLGRVIDFKTPVVCYARDGVLIFGQIEINTDDDEPEEDDFFDEDD